MNVPTKILDQHVAVLGKTRSGKSSVMRGLVENLLEREMPVCIVDPKGDWWGLKLAADGKHAGYPVVIFGGEHADIPINPNNQDAGKQIAELFATGNRPCLIDLGGWMVAPRTRFWIDFASTLFKHTKGNRWLVIDEVHNFCPKGSLKGADGDAAKALHWTNRLASEGLGKGLAMLFASQRPQKVHNDTLTSAETLIAMRVLHPSDRGAVADWIKGCGDSEGSEVLNSLANMDRGEGWVWSPEIGFGPKRVKFPMFKTYDSFRPQSVEDTKRLKGWAEVDLDEVRQKMAAVVEQAKADDPRELRRQITELKKQLAAAPAKTVAKTVTVVDQAAIDRAVASATKPLLKMLESFRSGVAHAVRTQRAVLDTLDRCVVNEPNPDSPPPAAAMRVAVEAPRTGPTARAAVVAKEQRREPPSDSGAAIGGTPQRMLDAMLFLETVGTSPAPRKAIAGLVLISSDTGTFRNYVSELRANGLIVDAPNLTLALTEAGRARASDEGLPRSRADLHAKWLTKLGGTAGRMMRVLLDAYPNGVDRAELGAACNIDSGTGTFRNYLSELRSPGLLVDVDRATVRAADALFPEGLS